MVRWEKESEEKRAMVRGRLPEEADVAWSQMRF